MQSPDKAKRGLAAQKESREQERQVKKRVVALDRAIKQAGGNSLKTADYLMMEPATVRAYQREWREFHFPIVARGRPAEVSSLEVREAIINTLYQLGPKTGVPAIQALYPNVARREIESLVVRFRRQYAEEDGKLAHELIWSHAGAVWAMDYTDPPAPIDGWYRDILVVRDLASGMELESLPVRRETGQATADALEMLIVRHGAPLVIKRDNGGTLKTPAVAKVLRKYGVEVLPSPVKTPQYNGSCEAGNGALKTRAHHVSSRNGRPGWWTCDDVEEARRLTNRSARPLGPLGPTPLETWSRRKLIEAKDRRAFRQQIRDNITESALAAESANPISKNDGIEEQQGLLDADTIQRRAVRRALESCGYLKYRRRNYSS